MDRGAMFAESHDLMLRKLPETTGRPLAFWLRSLDLEGFQKKGFLAGLEFLRDRKKVPHNEAASIMYTYMNPYLAPDELRGRSKDQDLAATLEGTRAANRRLRGKAGKARPAGQGAKKRQAPRAVRPAAKKKPARTAAATPAPKKKPARKAARPAAKKKPARTAAVTPAPKKKPARKAARPSPKKAARASARPRPGKKAARPSARPTARNVKRPARASAKKTPRQAARRPRARRSRR